MSAKENQFGGDFEEVFISGEIKRQLFQYCEEESLDFERTLNVAIERYLGNVMKHSRENSFLSYPRIDSRTLLAGLVFECPFHDAEECCVFGGLRQLPVAERIAWVRTLTEGEAEEYAEKHRACFQCRA